MKKALSVVRDILVWVLVAVAVTMMVFTVISAAFFDRNDRTLLGYRAYIIQSDSMSATDFAAGDLIFVKEVDPSTLEAGDIIAFRSVDSKTFGETFTHKIRDITSVNGAPAFVTYGTTTNTDDELPVRYENVLGKYRGKLTGIGTFFAFLKTTPGYLSCIFLPFALLIASQSFSVVRNYRAQKKEEQKQLDEEREQLVAEREEAKELLAQVKKLNAELSSRAEIQADAAATPISDMAQMQESATTSVPDTEPCALPAPGAEEEKTQTGGDSSHAEDILEAAKSLLAEAMNVLAETKDILSKSNKSDR